MSVMFDATFDDRRGPSGQVESKNAAVVGGVCNPVGRGRKARALGRGQSRNQFERPALLGDAVDTPAFPIESENTLRCYGNIGEARRAFIG